MGYVRDADTGDLSSVLETPSTEVSMQDTRQLDRKPLPVYESGPSLLLPATAVVVVAIGAALSGGSFTAEILLPGVFELIEQGIFLGSGAVCYTAHPSPLSACAHRRLRMA